MNDFERNAWIVTILAIYCFVMAIVKIIHNEKQIEILQEYADDQLDELHEYAIILGSDIDED